MERNFSAAVLKLLLNQTFFNGPERAVLEWLYSAANESEAVYWDNVTARQPGDDLDVVITNIKMKARHFCLQNAAEKLKGQYADAQHASV